MTTTMDAAARVSPGPAASSPTFYLGTHKPAWLEQTDVPLFVADQHLRGRKTLPRAAGRWALDSGGFMQLKNAGNWQFTERQYLANIARYQAEIGNLDWAAPMDWMCEPEIRASTGLTVREHQERTVANYLRMVELWPLEGDGPCPVVPSIQGDCVPAYRQCLAMYEAAGVDLARSPTVGLGSVCRRQSTSMIVIGLLVQDLAKFQGIRLHGFGVKITGLEGFGQYLVSADSTSWSITARREPPIAGHTHSHCGNCLEFALGWREDMLSKLGWLN